MSDRIYDGNTATSQDTQDNYAKSPLLDNQAQNPYSGLQTQQPQMYNPQQAYTQQVQQPQNYIPPPPYAQGDYTQQQQVVLIRPQNADGFRTPIVLQCPYCKQEGVTRTEFRVGNGTIMCTAIICILFGIFFLIPLLSDGCKDVFHFCPYCSQIVGQAKYEPC